MLATRQDDRPEPEPEDRQKDEARNYGDRVQWRIRVEGRQKTPNAKIPCREEGGKAVSSAHGERATANSAQAKGRLQQKQDVGIQSPSPPTQRQTSRETRKAQGSTASSKSETPRQLARRGFVGRPHATSEPSRDERATPIRSSGSRAARPKPRTALEREGRLGRRGEQQVRSGRQLSNSSGRGECYGDREPRELSTRHAPRACHDTARHVPARLRRGSQTRLAHAPRERAGAEAARPGKGQSECHSLGAEWERVRDGRNKEHQDALPPPFPSPGRPARSPRR